MNYRPFRNATTFQEKIEDALDLVALRFVAHARRA